MSTTTPSQAADDRPTTIREWCEKHNVIGAMIPFDYRRNHSFKQIQAVSEAIRQLPNTAASFRISTLDATTTPPTGSEVIETQMHLLGSWKYTETTDGQRWTNPNYVHGHPWQSSRLSAEDRIERLEYAAKLGCLRQKDVAPLFGLEKRSVEDFVQKYDVPWFQWRQHGRHRFARTIRLLHDWMGTPIKTLADPFPIKNETVEKWTRREASPDWEVPSDPSGRAGFQHGGEVDV